ncbi:MAG: acyl-CoA acyltransferase [Xanthobacteraceae bacterium]
MPSPAPSIRCRQIADADIAAVTALLARGFPARDYRFWQRALERLGKHETPPDLPRYGYLIESGGVVVGAVLLICSNLRVDGKLLPRCNLSSWYVDPAFRSYAPLLVSRALAHKNVTYLNISPAPHTWPIIEAQGFSRYCDGVFVAVPALCGLFGSAGAKAFDAGTRPAVTFDRFDEEILLRHAALGCISLWCTTAERAYPFVFRPRLVKTVLPCAQLIYCRDTADFVRFAGPIGRFLARRGRPLVIVDANAPIPGLLGIYRRGSMPKYFRGPQRPRLGDLAYTEYAVMGV